MNDLSNIYNDDEEDLNVEATDFSQLSFRFSQNDELLEIPIPDIGQTHPDWISFLEDFKSADIYSKRINDFIEWLQRQTETIFSPNETVLAKLKVYLNYNHDRQILVDGKLQPHYAPTIFRSWMSMFDAFWLHTGKGQLKELAPLIYSNLTKWESGYEETHASDFTKEELMRFHDDNEFPPTPLIKVMRAYSAIATANASRSGGTWKKDFTEVVELTSSGSNKENSPYPEYKIMYVREKKRGKIRNTDKDQIITGTLERKV